MKGSYYQLILLSEFYTSISWTVSARVVPVLIINLVDSQLPHNMLYNMLCLWYTIITYKTTTLLLLLLATKTAAPAAIKTNAVATMTALVVAY